MNDKPTPLHIAYYGAKSLPDTVLARAALVEVLAAMGPPLSAAHGTPAADADPEGGKAAP